MENVDSPLLHTTMCRDILTWGMESVPDTHVVYHWPSVRVSAITAADLRIFASTSADPVRVLRRVEAFLRCATIEPFGNAAAQEFARIDTELRRRTLRVHTRNAMAVAHANALHVPLAASEPRPLLRIPYANIVWYTFTAASSPLLVERPMPTSWQTGRGRSRQTGHG
jgi:predicted nucleic acid-binding protein